MYEAGKARRGKKRHVLRWFIVVVAIVLLLIWLGLFIRQKLKPKVVIKQSSAVTTRVDYSAQTKSYNETDFSINMPISWMPLPPPGGPYKSFTWSSGEQTQGQDIVVYEDSIPTNLAVNRVQIIDGAVDHVNLEGTVSDNCSQYTRGISPTPGQVGAPARWQGINFYCDQQNQQRDVIGTSSTDGPNIVVLKSVSTGQTHKFFFTYTDYATNPDYTVFTNALTSFKMN